GYLTSTRTPMIICYDNLTYPCAPRFLWTFGFLFPRLASSLLRYLSAQHRYRPCPLDCTFAAGKQISIHSPDIFHRLHPQGPLIPPSLADHSPTLKFLVSPCCCFSPDRSSCTQ
ncbi:hypothetical protein AMECASPLE_029605, partial [Ameca splendens]